jgi:hypothetical protein
MQLSIKKMDESAGPIFWHCMIMLEVLRGGVILIRE